MKKLLIAILTATLLLALVAQPAVASQATTEFPTLSLPYASSGVTKITSHWYGYKVYLSQDLCNTMGIVFSAGGLWSLGAWVATAGIFAAPIWACILGVGVTLLSISAKCQTGVVLTIYRIPWPGFPYGLLVPGPIKCQ